MTKQDEFECWEKNLIRSFFWKFWTILTLMQWTKSTIAYLNTPLQVIFLNWVRDGGIWTYSGPGIQICKRSKIKTNLFGSFGLSRHWFKEHKLKILQSRTSLHLVFFYAGADRRDEACTFVKYKFEDREKLEPKCFFWNFRAIKILM